MRRFFQRYPPLVIIAALWLLFMIFVAVSAPLISPYDYTAIDLRARLQAPVGMEGGDWKHVFGTDDLGRDVISRLIFSIRLSLLVAFLGTVIGAILGTALGFLAAHFRGWVDDVVMAAIDFQAALPFFIIALALLAFLGNSLTLFIGPDGYLRLGALRTTYTWTGIVGQDPWLRGCGQHPWRDPDKDLPAPYSS